MNTPSTNLEEEIIVDNPSFDPYCTFLEDMQRKIMWNTFFNHAFDFSMPFDKFRRVQAIFPMVLLVFSYLYYYEMHAQAHDMLLRALMAYEV